MHRRSRFRCPVLGCARRRDAEHRRPAKEGRLGAKAQCFRNIAAAPETAVDQQFRQNALVFAQGCADFSSDSSDRKRSSADRGSPFESRHKEIRNAATSVAESQQLLLGQMMMNAGLHEQR
jgi:hypothetical protein